MGKRSPLRDMRPLVCSELCPDCEERMGQPHYDDCPAVLALRSQSMRDIYDGWAVSEAMEARHG